MRLTAKNKKTVLTCLKIITFTLLLVLITTQIATILKDKNNYLKFSSFYTEKEPFDVLFFGSSRMLNAVYPMELWEDYGITSYNMAQHSEALRISYWQMKNAFQYNKPSVAVVEVALFAGGEITEEDEEMKSYLHKSVDHMKLTPLKYEMLMNVTKDVDISEYLFPLSIYHNRWNQLEENDIYQYPSSSKGAERRINITPMERMEWSSQNKAEGFNTEYIGLDGMVSLCKENNVQLVLTCMPTVWVCGDPGVCGVMNFLEDYAKEHGIFFYNLAKEENFINYATDFYDSSHLNPSGAGKITNYMGKYLMEHFDLPTKKNPTTVKAWDKCLDEYNNGKLAELQNAKYTNDIQNYLMLLNDCHFDFNIKFSDKNYTSERKIEALLDELDIEEPELSDKLQEGRAEITIYNQENGKELDKAVFQ